MNFDFKNSLQRSWACIEIPYIVGYMSVDEKREFHSDLSQLKFLTNIPQGRLNLDLNHNIHRASKRTTDGNGEKINLLLRFVLHQHSRINLNSTKYMFITYRRTLISVMCSAFCSDSVRIAASLFKGAIYLCSLETTDEIKRRQSRTHQEEKFCAWGYKFEQYLLSDKPHLLPNIEQPVKENEEFSIYYTSRLGQHHLLYGAQIDGMLAVHNVSKPPESAEVEPNLDYLRKYSFIELKTNREIQHYIQEQNFKKYKLLRCWCQCYLAGLEGLLVGFRNDRGIVQRLTYYKTEDIAAYCKNEWSPQKALEALDQFLTFTKKCFENIDIKQVQGDDVVSFEFEIDCNGTIKVKSLNVEDAILPDWYIQNHGRSQVQTGVNEMNS